MPGRDDDDCRWEFVEGLKVERDVGEGEVQLPKWFMKSTPIFRADVLRDWFDCLKDEYDKAIAEL
jgi:hypothetical protein